MEKLDLLIIGSGPAGLSASIYAARYKLNFICIGREHGGTANEAFKIQNYPGTPDIAGMELSKKMMDQAEALGAMIITGEIKSIKKDGEAFTVITDKETYFSNNLILALGTEIRKLKIPGEEEFHGKGVAYCATCDGFFFKNKVVAVVGGGDSALSAAVYLADIAEKVYLINRTSEFRGSPAWLETVQKTEKIELITGKTLKEIKGEHKVESVSFNETEEEIMLDGVFIEIGSTPATALLKDLDVKIDDTKHIIVAENQSTNIEGIYAAGDLTTGSNKLKQIVTACAEGAVAAAAIYKKIKKSR